MTLIAANDTSSSFADPSVAMNRTGDFVATWAHQSTAGSSVEALFSDVSIDETKIVPTNAADLNLNHLWGTEALTVPVTIPNPGTISTNGSLVIDVYLSTTADLSGTTTKIGSQTFNNVITAPPKNNVFVVNVEVACDQSEGGNEILRRCSSQSFRKSQKQRACRCHEGSE